MNYLPDEADDLTVGEVMRYYRGWQTRQARSWEQTRKLMYLIYGALGGNEAKDEYDFLPLKTDPTTEEREQLRKEAELERAEYVMSVFEFYRAQGLKV